MAFRNFKALRNAKLQLAPFNLVLGPNGSGKTSLIEALLQLRSLAALRPRDEGIGQSSLQSPDLRFRFDRPYERFEVQLSCQSDEVCDALSVAPPNESDWDDLRARISRIRNFEFDHLAMGASSSRQRGVELSVNGGNLAAVVAGMRDSAPNEYAAFSVEVLRLFPEFSQLNVRARPHDHVALAFTLVEEAKEIEAGELAQGMLFMLGFLALAFAPSPPSIVCLEELDRGIHPRMLREVRDTLYRLSYPSSFGIERDPVQVIATTHSPYLLDLFRDHPEEVVLTQKHGRVAHFERLSDRNDLPALLEDAALGDLWFSGILGAVPERKTDIE